MLKPVFHKALLFGALTLVLFGGAACQKRCQAAETVSYKSMVDTAWRLVETTDPGVKSGLNNFNFPIMTFNRNNTGDVKRVVDNDQYDTPVLTLVWVPDPAAGLVRIQYTSTDSATPTTGDQGTFDYQYKLSTQLTMTDRQYGYYYRYVPFKGIVNPDTVCKF